ncbi:hypothetical protein [Faecalimicrobium dakarense]|uniref:hypothetical protein n=1 Tax=Faecalimicrobium dakarense TaxID=1301100 RepID=UPI0004B26498|nr:hypothetical protein [[Clostridium] dakarense]
MKRIANANNTNKTSPKSFLCNFGYVDYIVLASTISIALGEELSSNDLNVLASFFAVLSDELALISAVESCPSNSDDSSNNESGSDDFTFVPPGVARTSNNTEKNSAPKKRTVIKKKVIKKKRKKGKTLKGKLS